MKLLPLILSVFFITACDKTDMERQEKSLAGQWEWVQSQGGIAAMTYKASESDQRQLIFSAGGDYELKQNGNPILKSKYQLKDSTSINFSGIVPMIHVMNNSVTYLRQAYTLKNNELILFDEYNDGFTHTYKKAR